MEKFAVSVTFALLSLYKNRFGDKKMVSKTEDVLDRKKWSNILATLINGIPFHAHLFLLSHNLVETKMNIHFHEVGAVICRWWKESVNHFLMANCTISITWLLFYLRTWINQLVFVINDDSHKMKHSLSVNMSTCEFNNYLRWQCKIFYHRLYFKIRMTVFWLSNVCVCVRVSE